MKYTSINEIFEANTRFSEKLKNAVGELSAEQASVVPEGEKWSVAHTVEHIAIVEEGIAAICRKLLDKAEKEGLSNNGLSFSNDFVEGADKINGLKLEAPDMVKPVGGISIDESLTRLESSMQKIEGLKTQFGAVDCNTHKFPHPYLGGLSAAEWLALAGFHKYRHTRQIKQIISRLS